MLLIEAQKISCHAVIFEQLMPGSLNLSVFMELKLSLSKSISLSIPVKSLSCYFFLFLYFCDSINQFLQFKYWTKLIYETKL